MDLSSGTRHPARKALLEVLVFVALLLVGYFVIAQELAPKLPAQDIVATSR